MPPPSTQLPPQLKWHNTLPAHFSENQAPRSLVTPGRRAEKRQQPSPDAASLRAWNEGGELHPDMETTGNVQSPTKRHRTIGRALGSNMTTPTKANSGNNGSGSFSSAGSGMQTPPPSGSSMSKRRGRPPKGIPSFESPRVTTSPAASPSKGPRYIKSSSAIDPTKLQGSPLRPSASISKDMLSSELHDAKSSILDADTSIDWPSFDEGFPTTSMGSDIFLHSDMGYGDLADPMAFSFNCPNDFDDDSVPSIDPNLIFSSRPTSDASSIFGGYTDDTDVLSSSSIANEQPYQHQYNYNRRERALELQRVQRRKEKAMRNADPRLSDTTDSSLRRSFSDNVLQPSSSFRAASLDEAVSRQGSVTRGRENTTPPASVRHLQPKTEVKLLISPSGRAKTETKVVYDDSDTEPDEVATSGNSLDESMESDSSMDESTPRGLGPGGKPYSAVRKAKNAGPLLHRGPKLGLFSTTPYTGSSSDPGWSVLEDPSSPPHIVTKSVERSATRESGVSQTPRRYLGRSLDECILSSPKLPTPLRSTPGGIHSRPRILSPANYHGSLRMDSRLQAQTILDISDESEAETVVDENVDPDPEPEAPRMIEEDQEGNALQALRHAVAKRRGVIPGESMIMAFNNDSS
ncbi:hypothetical protein BGX38DRAFT_126803 [Terfezia claveryi]|nr:hypothetical protein BGX38DRAFT_126803 [Terfezia claveryi]